MSGKSWLSNSSTVFIGSPEAVSFDKSDQRFVFHDRLKNGTSNPLESRLRKLRFNEIPRWTMKDDGGGTRPQRKEERR
jgi:hypothetical protein